MQKLILLTLLATSLLACGPSENAEVETQAEESTPPRIVSLSGTLTEVLYDLDQGDNLVGVDVTSTYPAEANELPKLGHVSSLSVEGVMNLKPTVIFVDAEQAGKPALKTLRESGIEVVPVENTPTLGNAERVARQLAPHLRGVAPETFSKYAEQLKRDSLTLVETLEKHPARPSVLFIYARGANQMMVAGSDTEAASIIELAGGRNAIEAASGFKPMTPEALVAAAPEHILLFESGLESLDGREGLANIPGIVQTPAYKNDRITAMDGHYLLGFGPRAAQAANELALALHAPNTK